MSKLAHIRQRLGERAYGLGSNYICFMATGPDGTRQPHTVIEAEGKEDTQLIVSGNLPKGPIFRSGDVSATFNHIQTLH